MPNPILRSAKRVSKDASAPVGAVALRDGRYAASSGVTVKWLCLRT
jgi:hypothetical protein